MIPFTASIHIRWGSPAGRHLHRLHLWIPLFLLWILLLLLFPVVALVCLFVRINPLSLCAATWGILSSLRHTFVEVNSPGTEVRVRLS